MIEQVKDFNAKLRGDALRYWRIFDNGKVDISSLAEQLVSPCVRRSKVDIECIWIDPLQRLMVLDAVGHSLVRKASQVGAVSVLPRCARVSVGIGILNGRPDLKLIRLLKFQPFVKSQHPVRKGGG